uniref:Uncharacterized protein n=1 Tax=Anguilla anguilla TaxID=7936 RepID=A0A0E9R3A0_ANGAN
MVKCTGSGVKYVQAVRRDLNKAFQSREDWDLTTDTHGQMQYLLDSSYLGRTVAE